MRKYFGDEPDMERLDDVLSKAADKSGTFGSSGKESPTSKLPKSHFGVACLYQNESGYEEGGLWLTMINLQGLIWGFCPL